MQNITDIINDLEKENKLIDIRNKCTAYVKEANNIKLALDVLYNDIDSDQRFRLEYCSIPDANNNNVYYYRFSIFSLDTILSFNRNLRDMDNNERKLLFAQPMEFFALENLIYQNVKSIF